MPRGFGTPRFATLAAQRYYEPADLNYSARAYNALTESSVVSLEGFASFSLYIILTSAGNNEIYVTARNDTGTANLAQIAITAAHVGSASYRHWAFGVGTTIPLVAREVFFEVRSTAGLAGACTAWLFCRGV